MTPREELLEMLYRLAMAGDLRAATIWLDQVPGSSEPPALLELMRQMTADDDADDADDADA